MSLAPLPSPTTLDPAFVCAFRAGTLTPEQVEAAVPRDRSAMIFLLLQLSAAVATGTTTPASGPHTPSGSIPPYAKPTPPKRRPKKRGAQPGHKGSARPIPSAIDHHRTHQLPACPCCGGQLVKTGRTRTRVIEDIPDNLKPEVTEHTIHRDWCPTCRTQVEPKVPDALPQCALGHRAVTLTAWLHYGVGTTTTQIVDVLGRHLRLPISDGGLTQMWHRLADVLTPWYEHIQDRCRNAGVLHADETGWRVVGHTWWLWCFCTPDAAYYMIDASRGHPALERFFVDEFRGILVTDFWKAYDAIGRTKQKCWPHLLRELKEIDKTAHGTSDWDAFAKRLRRVYADAVRLEMQRAALPKTTFDSRLCALHVRIDALAAQTWAHDDARRLAKRLRTYGAELLTFVEFEGVPADNNFAERTLRPAVQMRKGSYGNQSVKGARTRSILMSIYQTLKLRGLDPLEVTEAALRAYVERGALPPLPEGPKNTS
jgi:transposase